MLSLLRYRSNTNAVKEAYDNLPSGICFFSGKGMPVLCNRLMHQLAYSLTGKDLQYMTEFEEALAHPKHGVTIISAERRNMQFPDGRVWHFEKNTIEQGYIQYTAYDISNMYDAKLRLDERNKELEEANRRMERVLLRIAETTRQQEILAAKMTVHNKMGRSVLDLRRFLRNGCPKEEKKELIASWRETLSSLAGEVGSDKVEPLDELIRIAKNSGLDILIDGTMPENPVAAYMIVIAMRECVTNTIRHAKGTELHVKISKEQGMVDAVFTDNGTPPAGTVSMGGGLSSLKKKIEQTGGTFRMESQPIFTIGVSVPEVVEEEYEGVYL